jgi:DNA sulfur modification protein DndE
MREPTPPADPKEKLDGGVEMTWKVFAGDEAEFFAALVNLRVQTDGYTENHEGAAKCLRAHINRGLSYLSSGKETRSISDFVSRWIS